METMANDVKKNSLNLNNLFSTKVWTAIALILFVTIFALVSYRVYQSQPAEIVINPQNLNTAEYERLAKVMGDEDVGSFFTAKLPLLKNKVMTQDWVSQVDIERKWGQGIVITALPREPVARFGTDHLIDVEGQVFKPVSESEFSSDSFIMLQGDAEQSSLIMTQMQLINQWFSTLDMQVEDMVLTPRMTWIIRFNNGFRVIVDNEQTSQKLMNLSQILQNQLNNRLNNIESADLRYKNGFVIDWKDNEPQTFG